MESPFRIDITSERRTKRNRVMELEIHHEGDHFFAIATLYDRDLYINLPANPLANGFIDWLSNYIGGPAEPPIVKCSANWTENMVGAMQTVVWKLEPARIESLDLVLQKPSRNRGRVESAND